MMRKNSQNRRVLNFIRVLRRQTSGTLPSSIPPAEQRSALSGSAAFPLRAKEDRDDRGDDVLRHMSSLLDSVTTGIVSLDGEGRVRVFNAVAEALFALPRSRVVGRPFREVGQIMSFKDHAPRALWERLSDAVWAAGAALDLEYDLVAKDGSRRTISYSVYPLGRMAWSVGNGVVIMLEDITRKKEMEGQISDARKRLLAVFDGITDGIQAVDAEFRVTAVNKSMTALLSRPIRIGGYCYEAFGARAGICPDCPAVETFRSGQPAAVTRKLSTTASDANADEGERCVEISTFPLLDRGNRVVQVVEYIKDVTEKARLAERLEHSRRLAELGETAARIAHEVRNPLNAIAGAAHYLSNEYAADETIQQFTSIIQRQSARLNQVASDILNAARPMRLNRTSINVNAVLGQAMGPLCELIEHQGITVENRCAADLPPVYADELQIEQALHNILRNAVEAMPQGGALRIDTAAAAEGGWVEVGVQDSGPGIPDDDRERVFQSFFTTKTGGTGLGLTIVLGVLKNHGGEITIERPAAGGVRVLVRLPIDGKGNVSR